MYSSITIANRILDLAKERGLTFTPMQLLKLVYIAHGWMLGLYQNPLIRDEVQAWQYGPVIPDLYKQVRNFRSAPVEGPLTGPSDGELNSRELNLLTQVVDMYGKYTGPQLSSMTHTDDSPWAKVYEEGTFGVTIPNDLIEDHYVKMAKKN